jgi:hypothetical protein
MYERMYIHLFQVSTMTFRRRVEHDPIRSFRCLDLNKVVDAVDGHPLLQETAQVLKRAARTITFSIIV